MRQRRAVHVAHRHRGDEIAVEQGRAGKRERLAADDAALVRLRQAGCECGDLLRLLAAMAGDRAGQSVEQEILAVIADALRNIVILQRCRKAGQHFGHVCGHTRLPCKFAKYGTTPKTSARMVIGLRPRCQFVARCLSICLPGQARSARAGTQEHRPVFVGRRFRGDDRRKRARSLNGANRHPGSNLMRV
jgi:hypothetical protein